MEPIVVSELMSSKVKSVESHASLQDAVRLMRDHSLSCIVVLTDEKPVGIITERDLMRLFASCLECSQLTNPSIQDCMTKNPIFICDDATLHDALIITQSNKIRHLPVIDANQFLVGILTQSDLTRAHFKIIEGERNRVEQEIQVRTLELQKANAKLKNLSLTDSMLDIGNRRSMSADLMVVHSHALRYKTTYSVSLIDVDHFKLYNDHYGHQAGDEALMAITRVIKDSLRTCDRVYRYGGEELLILLAETTTQTAYLVIERTLKLLGDKKIEHLKSPFKQLTFSAGNASIDAFAKPPASWEDLVELADTNLYKAKNSGRNCIC